MRADFSVAQLQTLGGFELSTRGLGALGDLTGDGLPDLAFGGVINNHDRVLLLSIVAGGLGEWMRTSGRAFKGFKVSDLQRELVFRTLEEQAGEESRYHVSWLPPNHLRHRDD